MSKKTRDVIRRQARREERRVENSLARDTAVQQAVQDQLVLAHAKAAHSQGFSSYELVEVKVEGGVGILVLRTRWFTKKTKAFFKEQEMMNTKLAAWLKTARIENEEITIRLVPS